MVVGEYQTAFTFWKAYLGMFLQFSMCQREVPDIVSLPKCFVDALETFFGKFCEANSKMMKVDAY